MSLLFLVVPSACSPCSSICSVPPAVTLWSWPACYFSYEPFTTTRACDSSVCQTSIAGNSKWCAIGQPRCKSPRPTLYYHGGHCKKREYYESCGRPTRGNSPRDVLMNSKQEGHLTRRKTVAALVLPDLLRRDWPRRAFPQVPKDH